MSWMTQTHDRKMSWKYMKYSYLHIQNFCLNWIWYEKYQNNFFFKKKYARQTLWGLTCKNGTLYNKWNIPFHYMSHLWGTHMDHSFRVKKSERSYRFWVKSKKDWCSCRLNVISTIDVLLTWIGERQCWFYQYLTLIELNWIVSRREQISVNLIIQYEIDYCSTCSSHIIEYCTVHVHNR